MLVDIPESRRPSRPLSRPSRPVSRPSRSGVLIKVPESRRSSRPVSRPPVQRRAAAQGYESMPSAYGRGTTRAEDAQGTPTQSHTSPSILVYEDIQHPHGVLVDIPESRRPSRPLSRPSRPVSRPVSRPAEPNWPRVLFAGERAASLF